MKRNKNVAFMYGLCFGLLFGVLTDNITYGLCIGLAFGLLAKGRTKQ